MRTFLRGSESIIRRAGSKDGKAVDVVGSRDAESHGEPAGDQLTRVDNRGG